jgi:hypothetical protein
VIIPAPVPRALPVHFGLAAPTGLPAVLGPALWGIGVRPDRDGVWLDDDLFVATFGPWRLSTPTSNVRGAHLGGPYSAWRAIGPRLSLADGGLTFGTATDRGVCVHFREPVPGIEPTGLLRHPTLTVTVAQPGMLVEALKRARSRSRP